MERIKYDSLYKFIVSIGIAIILIPFIFIIAILKNNDIVLISSNEINQLTNTAQEIIMMEQNYKHIILSHPIIYCVVASIVIMVGGLIVLYGIMQWKNKVQKYEDKSRELSNKLLERQIQNLTPEEKEEKVKEEIISNNQIINNESKKLDMKDNLNKNKIQKYMQVEREVLNKIKRVFKKYEIFEEVRLEKQRYDCIALKTEDSIFDYIFEIKYFTNINSIKGKIRMLEKQIVDLEYTYLKSTNRNAELILIIIVDSITDKDRFENKKLIDSIQKQGLGLSKLIISDVNNIEEELRKIKKI